MIFYTAENTPLLFIVIIKGNRFLQRKQFGLLRQISP